MTYTSTLLAIYKGIARILQRGFLLVVDQRSGSLGAQPPEADEYSF